jgi:uncharacterized membrane protein
MEAAMHALGLSALLLSPVALGQVTISQVPFRIEALSTDGRVAVGTSSTQSPMLWRDGLVMSLGLPPGLGDARAVAVSGDGAVIAGIGTPPVTAQSRPTTSWVWTAEHGFTIISVPGHKAVFTSCISRDGQVVAGAVPQASGYHGFVWTRDQGGRVVPAGGNYATWIHALSADGNAATGSGSSDIGTWAVVWPSTYLWCNILGTVPGQLGAIGFGMTPDGGTIVGSTHYSNAFVWAADTGIQTFSLPGLSTPRLTHISDDARIAAGSFNNESWGLIWRRGFGLITSESYLVPRGVPAYTARMPVIGLSANGQVLALSPQVSTFIGSIVNLGTCGSSDFNHDGDTGTDGDIEAFFACLSGNCCPFCDSADFNFDGDIGTDQDIEAFFRVLAGQPC